MGTRNNLRADVVILYVFVLARCRRARLHSPSDGQFAHRRRVRYPTHVFCGTISDRIRDRGKGIGFFNFTTQNTLSFLLAVLLTFFMQAADVIKAAGSPAS